MKRMIQLYDFLNDSGVISINKTRILTQRKESEEAVDP